MDRAVTSYLNKHNSQEGSKLTFLLGAQTKTYNFIMDKYLQI